MSRFFFFAALLILLASCVTEHPGFILTPPPEEPAVISIPFVIMDHRNSNLGLGIPEWANRFFESGARGIQVMEANLDSYLFIARSEGNNFNALHLWKDGFNAELVFPRLAATRVESRFSTGVHFPDIEFGALYETLIRAVSDAHWTGMSREDDFWIRRSFLSDDPYASEVEREDWEFLILVAIEKSHFASQLNSIFQNIYPRHPPTAAQRLAFDRVVERFFEGF